MRTYTIIYKIVPVLFLLASISCTSQDEVQIDGQNDNNQPISYLALGDSYTIGQGVEDSLRWPNQLSEKIVENGYEVELTDIIAQTGWTTGNLINAIENAELADYNLVSLLIGVNNQFQNQSFDIFTTEFDLLLSKSIELAGGRERVFVLSIPDYGVTPFGSNNSEQIAQELDTYNDYIRQKCMDQNIPFVDITEISRQLGSSEGALAPDNLHPSGTQYTLWVEETLPVVLDIIMD